MNNSLTPAIITGITGIIGIIINVSINLLGRYSDLKEARRTKNIESYETFYEPLSEKVLSLKNKINTIVKKENDIDSSKIIAYLMSESPPANLLNLLQEVRQTVDDIILFTKENNYKYIEDFKLKYYYSKFVDFIFSLNSISELNGEKLIPSFESSCVDELLKRIDYISVKIYSSNIFGFVYNYFWKKRK